MFRLFFIGIYALLSLCSAQDDLVETTLGPVLGSVRATSEGRHYRSWQGIPFAAPPVGNLRLVPPQPPQPWTEVKDLSGDSAIMCPQLSETVSGDLLGQEDCLYLNIYSPVQEPAARSLLPVMVYIYGGGFVTGSNRIEEYGPEKWMDQDIIVVIPNYRLYTLGFLSLGTAHAPGNQGLIDQVMALRFVQDNIERFGGDASMVTLAGQSAGSSSTLYHLMSPLSTGLFHRVIAQSGSNFSPSLHSITADEAARFGNEAAIAMGCVIGDFGDRRLECLQGVEVEKLVRLNQALGVNLKPNEDLDDAGAGSMLPMSPMEALRTGSYHQNVTVMIGSNENDGLILTTPLTTDPSLYILYRSLWSVIAPGILFHVPVEGSSLEMSRKASELADYYLGGSSNIRPENFDEITDMFTDAFVTYAVECFLDYAKTSQTVYQYRYTHFGENGLNPDDGLPHLGVNHADELYLMWNPVFYQNRTLTAEDKEVSGIIMKAWSSFIRTGTPEVDNLAWPPMSMENNLYLNIDNVPRMERSEKYDIDMKFWRELFPC